VAVVNILKNIKVNHATALLARIVGRSLCSTVNSFTFVATTGRSGTHTLERLFSTIPSAAAFHEPHPSMNGENLRQFNKGNKKYVEREFILRKLPNIYWSAKMKKFYIEANHLFIKCFADFAVEKFKNRLQVLHLHRDPIQVSSSYYLRGCIPGKDNIKNSNLRGIDWLIDPAAKENLIQMAYLFQEGPFNHDFFKLIWYCYETDARLMKFRIKYPEIPVTYFETSNLNNIDSVKDLFTSLNFPITDKLTYMVGIRSDKSPIETVIPKDIHQNDLTEFNKLCIKNLNLIKNHDDLTS